jgi:hypothetical protein
MIFNLRSARLRFNSNRTSEAKVAYLERLAIGVNEDIGGLQVNEWDAQRNSYFEIAMNNTMGMNPKQSLQ